MGQHPVSNEVGAALGAFLAGGAGPSHSALTRVFERTGYGGAAPRTYVPGTQGPNKEDRVRRTVLDAVREPHRSKQLIDGLLDEYRVCRMFDPDADGDTRAKVRYLREAFLRIDWELSDDGQIRPAGLGAIASLEGRPAIEEQLARLRRASDDPALLLGTAKEMLESTAKYVLERFSVPMEKLDFGGLWYHARDRLGLLPQDADVSAPGGKQVRSILQSSWAIAEAVNDLRNLEGTGHGKTLPTGVSPEMALLVVREACSIAEMVLATLDRHLGR